MDPMIGGHTSFDHYSIIGYSLNTIFICFFFISIKGAKLQTIGKSIIVVAVDVVFDSRRVAKGWLLGEGCLGKVARGRFQ